MQPDSLVWQLGFPVGLQKIGSSGQGFVFDVDDNLVVFFSGFQDLLFLVAPSTLKHLATKPARK